jgi:hypothetical protein
MNNSEAEKYFEEYREWLKLELTKLSSYVRLYRRLHERKEDRLKEMNTAPAFFSTVIDALFSAIVLWVDKLFSERSERGLVNLLSFIEQHHHIFDIKELQRRKNYPNDHWMLQNRTPIRLEAFGPIEKESPYSNHCLALNVGGTNTTHISTRNTSSIEPNYKQTLL